MHDSFDNTKEIMEDQSVENDLTTDNQKPDNKNQHHHRKRKKHFYNAIRKQMEFYFSDSNLSKDRFLKKIISSDPYVPLNVFMNFNRIKEMARSIEDIEKSLENSEMLELSRDKQSVRRVTAVQQKPNVDECTVYVESLPPNSTHDSIIQQFKQFGPIAYVSLPKYPLSGRIKEFGFVEFEHKSSVEKCLSFFKNLDGVIDSNYNPEKMQSITSFKNEQEEYATSKNENSSGTAATDDSGKKISLDGTKSKKPEQRSAKRPLPDEDDDNLEGEISDADSLPSNTSQPLPPKRVKLDDEMVRFAENSGKENDGNIDQSEECDQNFDEDQEDCDLHNRNTSKRKRRKHKKTKTIDVDYQPRLDPFNNLQSVDNKNSASNSLSMLRVATKSEWKRLRNKYLAIQREQYALFKKQTASDKKQAKPNQKKSTLPPLPVIIKNRTQKSQSPQNQNTYSNHSISFYGANEEEPNNVSTIEDENSKIKKEKVIEQTKSINTHLTSHAQKNTTTFDYEPGLIVKINFDEPCVDVADFKAEMKQYNFVRYVDLKEGQTFANIRVDSPRSAPILIKFCAPYRCQILTGDNETEYWKKIQRDREEKLSKTVRVRGNRKRLSPTFKTVQYSQTKKSNVHIRFEE